MYLVEFFGLKIKPKITKGKGMWNPLPTHKRADGIAVIRDKDVNLFLIPSDNGYIAIDSGYKNSFSVENGLKMLGIKPESVKAVFLTHLDIDHAGGVDAKSKDVFPNAQVWLGAEEEKYLNGQYARKKIIGLRCKSPITLRSDYVSIYGIEEVTIDGITIGIVPCYGHTKGHIAYRFNNILFSGDCIISDGNNGYMFYDFWNADSNQLHESLKALKEYCETNGVEEIVTSHSGTLKTVQAFDGINEKINWRKKGFVFNKNAPYNAYKE
ncbi:MAG: MBL fold metallo-hydrolase [Ruminococcaceae bacterium]|nr:MBL fold metallo-hydrolase [Oscillospiraceae bacterium]